MSPYGALWPYPLSYREIGPEFDEDEWADWETLMEFRLVYEGPLKSSGNRSKGPSSRLEQKHKLRQRFHPQLEQLWKTHPGLRALNAQVESRSRFTSSLAEFATANTVAIRDGSPILINKLAQKFDVGGFNFVPLVSSAVALTCGLDILFLRRDEPGNLLKQGGDIDGRIKTLLDALKVPKVGETYGAPEANEHPFFCLLQDDSLVTDINITTDRLLTAGQGGHLDNNVLLVIRVITRHSEVKWENLTLL